VCEIIMRIIRAVSGLRRADSGEPRQAARDAADKMYEELSRHREAVRRIIDDEPDIMSALLQDMRRENRVENRK